MSELRLRELGREAETLVDLPDLGSLERRGRAMRFRRQVGVVAAAVVLATTGVFLFQDRTSQGSTPAPPLGADDLPRAADAGPRGGDLRADAVLDGAEPTVLITVPEGWNSWVGPNRFAGHCPARPTSRRLARSTWSVGVTASR